MGFYAKKPVVIEARRWWPAVVGKATPIIQWVLDNDGTATFKCGRVCCDYLNGIYIQTLEGNMLTRPGDWVIKGVAGEFYPCMNHIFEATYEEAKT